MRLSAVLFLVLACLMIFTFHDVNGDNHHKKGGGHKDMSPHGNRVPSPNGKDVVMPVKPPMGPRDGSKGHHRHEHKHSSKDRHRSPSGSKKHHKDKHHDKNKHTKNQHGHKKDHRS